MKKALAIITLILLNGCSVFMAAKQPDAKNTDLFKLGTHRSMLLGEFGMPVVSELENGQKIEVFKFVDGYSTGAKVGRAMGHGVADVLTLGLWEVIGTPTEAAFDGDETSYQVKYDDKNRISEVIKLTQD